MLYHGVVAADSATVAISVSTPSPTQMLVATIGYGHDEHIQRTVVSFPFPSDTIVSPATSIGETGVQVSDALNQSGTEMKVDQIFPSVAP